MPDWDTTANDNIIPAETTNIVINHMVVRQEDQKMHRSLMYALSDAPNTASALQATTPRPEAAAKHYLPRSPR